MIQRRIPSFRAIDCWLACKSQPISLISASFNPSAVSVDAAQSTRIDSEAGVVMTSMYVRVNAKCAHQVRPPPQGR